MTDNRFRELVNLYLDREIQPADLRFLESEISRDPARRRDFESCCRLHIAMQQLMGSEQPSSAVASSDKSESPELLSRWVRWVPAMSVGIAACAALGVVFFVPVVSDTNAEVTLNETVTEYPRTIPSTHESGTIESSDLRRFASQRDREERRSVSLAAEFRLIGLHPEVASNPEQLQRVEVVPVNRIREPRIRVLAEMDDYSKMPDPELLQMRSADFERETRFSSEPSNSGLMPGFRTSLVGF